ncbi:hypothetical protein [Herbidospora cretacea]|uniref:hypothetical protein n=1 Tax=Herbidospora cretacea TaxID=28444 RepID=UPI0012DD5278|nr:hypothetical protein [Herbidospora cretacea]
MRQVAWWGSSGRDCLVYVLVPVGMVFAFILFWRLSYLPYRDWSLRPEEGR